MTQRRRLVTPEATQLGVRLSKADYERVQQLVEAGLYRSAADFLREAVRDKLRSMEVISIQNTTPDKAEKMIEHYLKKHPGPSFASEIADALGLDYGVTFKVINKLLEEGRIKKAKT